MPALLATLHDLLVGLIGAGVLGLLSVLAREWFNATRVEELDRERPAREPAVDLPAEANAFKARRDQEFMDDRRVA